MEKSFGDTIKNLRESKNLTLREVALKLKIDTSMLGKIEKNTRTPTYQIIENIALIFNVKEAELRVAYLSDKIVYQLIQDEDCADEILKAAKQKITHLKSNKAFNK